MSQSNPDSYILIIKDEPYEAVLKPEQGLVNQTIDSDLEIKERWYTVNGKKIPEINILWNVRGITSETASSLDTREQIQLLKDYLHGQKTINSIKNHRDSFIVNAKNDYDIAVKNIFNEHPDYENSCSASLRFACSILKSKIEAENMEFEDSQSLNSLAKKLSNDDFKEIEEIIPWVQKDAQEENEASHASFEDAVNAVRSSIALYAKLYPGEKDGKRNRPVLKIAS